MIRITVVADGRRLGSVILDGQKIIVIATPKDAEQDLWDALGEVYGALQGRERAEVKGE
jgi:hypothetical protein